MAELGSGDYIYQVAEGWGQLPEGWSFKEVAAGGSVETGHQNLRRSSSGFMLTLHRQPFN